MKKLEKKLGELLIEAGLATPREIDNALQAQMIFGNHLGTNLVELGVLDIDTLAAFLSRQYGVPRATREELANLPKEILDLVPAAAAQRLCLLPLRIIGERLVVAMINPGEERIVERISQNLGMPVECRVATEIEIRYYLEMYYDIPREPRHIVLMKQVLAEPGAFSSTKTLAAHLDRHLSPAQAIAHYFEGVRSLEKIPIRVPVEDLTGFDLTPELTFVLHSVDGFSTLQEILTAGIYPRVLTLRALIYLATLQLVRFEET